MSRVHEAMRDLERRTATEKPAPAPASNLISALIGELADEVPDDPNLEAVRADLLSVSRSYENDKKKDLALRFYIAMRSALRAHEILLERLKKAERKSRPNEVSIAEGAHVPPLDREQSTPEVHALEPRPSQHTDDSHSHQS
jgi:hypothetical protein